MEIKFDKEYGLRCGDYVLKPYLRELWDIIDIRHKEYIVNRLHVKILTHKVFGGSKPNDWEQISEHILKSKVREVTTQNRDVKE